MHGWVVEVVQVGDEWWCEVWLTGTCEVIQDGGYATAEAALDAGNKIAYDQWVDVREPRE